MESDVSGNDQFEEEIEEFDSLEEVEEVETEEGEENQDEISESESVTVTSIDYTPMLENLQNDIRFNSVILLAFLLLFGLLKGLKKL